MKRIVLQVVVIFLFLFVSSSLVDSDLVFSESMVQDEEFDEVKKVISERGVSGECLNRLSEIYSRVGSDLRDVLIDMHYIESRYDSLAVSFSGDYGIGQINPRWWGGNQLKEFLEDIGLSEELSFYDVVYSAENCILYSEWILRKFLEKSNGDLRLALRLYNGSWAYADKVLGLK